VVAERGAASWNQRVESERLIVQQNQRKELDVSHTLSLSIIAVMLLSNTAVLADPCKPDPCGIYHPDDRQRMWQDLQEVKKAYAAEAAEAAERAAKQARNGN
jgi:hypothetical protein